MGEDIRSDADNIISLEQFRNSVRQSERTPFSDFPNPYIAADYLTFQAAQRIRTILNDSKTSDEMVVVSRFVIDQETSVDGVTESVDGKTDSDVVWAYAVNKNVNDFESLTLDLETYAERSAQRLQRVADRLFTAGLIAHHILREESRISSVGEISWPRLGNEAFRPENGEHAKQITEWRAASTLGILALTEQRLGLRTEISKYLSVVLKSRSDYAKSHILIKRLLQLPPDNEVDISDFLIGFCNPLNLFELKIIVPSAKLK